QWPYRRGFGGRRDGGNPRLGIFVKAQPVFPPAPFLHTTVRVVPRDQTRWAATPGFIQNPFGDWYLTMGAESNPSSGCSGLLQSELNRLSDLDPTNFAYRERLAYSQLDEEA